MDSSITEWKNLNYVFGKNGTGKSSLAEELMLQNNSEYQTYLYDGSDGIIKDKDGNDKDGLGFILLGKKNIEIDGKIDEQQRLRNIEQEKLDSSYSQLKNQEEIVKTKKEACETTLWNGILNQYHEFDSDLDNIRLKNNKKLWNRRSKSLFFESMSSLLESAEYTINSKTIEELRNTKKTFTGDTTFPLYQELPSWEDITVLRKTLQETLGASVLGTFAYTLKEHHLEDWFNQGWQILQNNSEQNCPFCNQPIDETNQENLQNTYSQVIDSAYQTMKDTLANVSSSLERYQTSIDNTLSIAQRQSDLTDEPRYKVKVQEVNKLLHKTINEINIALRNKSADFTFTTDDSTIAIWREQLDSAISSWNDSIHKKNDNIQEHNNIVNQRDAIAKEFPKEIIGSIKACISQPDYTKLWVDLQQATTKKETIDREKETIVNHLNALDTTIDSLRKQTVDEKQAADRINGILKSMGNQSFTLVSDGKPDGLYKISDSEANIRSISKLSTGEKNLIAFLYFMIKVKSSFADNPKAKPLVIFDDPMNSNDDASQYIMTTEINSLNETISKRDGALVVLTHNAYFYINVRPSQPKKTQAYFLLEKSTGKTKIISIHRDSNQDVKTGYDALWNDLYFAYVNDNPSLMLNQMRRILETYQNFNNSHVKIAGALKSIITPEDSMIAQALLKSLNVNSHDITDLDYIPSTGTPEILKDLFEKVFTSLGAKEHFAAHWKNSSPKQD